jgi:outer membrane protein assembly factor BamB
MAGVSKFQSLAVLLSKIDSYTKLSTAMRLYQSLFVLLSFFIALTCTAQNPQLKKLWETDSTLRVPESVLYYEKENVLFVSNIDGKSDQKDLKGSISKVDVNGKILELEWATNLSAPKGMGIFENNLYVADLTEVVAIDLKTAKIARRVPVEGSIFLNDITIDKSGRVYVSDSRGGKVYQIMDNEVSLYIDNKKGVNGLLAVDDNLFLAVKDTLFKADRGKKLTVVTTGMDESSDGIVMVDGKNFLVSCWNGVIYHVNADGGKKILIDTRAIKSNTADIGFDSKNSVLFVPTFFKNKVVAYKYSVTN